MSENGHKVDRQGLMMPLARFVLFVSIFTAALVILDRIPRVVDKKALRQYPSIEKIKAAPGFEALKVPSYFPESVTWPPAQIIGMSRPFMAALMVFDGKPGKKTLVISQSTSSKFDAHGALELMELRQSVEVDLLGRSAVLETGLCYGESQCSRISWKDDGLYISALMRAPSVSLLRIARSMAGN